MVRSRFKKPVRLAVLVIKSGEKNCESWCFKEIIGIGFMVDEKWFGDDYLIINEAIFLSEITSYRLRSCLCEFASYWFGWSSRCMDTVLAFAGMVHERQRINKKQALLGISMILPRHRFFDVGAFF